MFFLIFFVEWAIIPLGTKEESFRPRRRPAHLLAQDLDGHAVVGLDHHLVMDMHHD